ncbi:helix-turn-helix domain-containing protein [Chryseobacterium rhizosphaerae]|uniref:helix-turn-helix domain-containing protein n=1 Tax=Chryseobacterium rhizosphaerae TaxID=395937 RepID=UPI0023588327|nr:helix-turn-helix domain-containing protein [Chryseobacterium rhizosphaerae]MDC8102349.1 helix-turn-helix domain-containing protein [Chryseobacterium rhizosphaerae]
MKHIFLIKIIIILLFGNLVYAQRSKIDSLYEFEYPELKNKFYDYCDHNKVPQAKQIAKYYLQKAKKENNILEIAEGYNLIHFNEKFPTALKYIDSLATITKDIKGNLYPARSYLLKGNLYYKHDNLKAALDNYILALKYAKEQNDKKQTAYANMNIAYINSYIGKNAEAAKIFRYYLYNGNNITDDYQHNQMRIALISCYLEINKLDSANILIKEGEKYALVGKNKYDLNSYSYLSGTYDLKLKKYSTAIIKLSNAYTYFTNSNENNNANYSLFNLGKAYQGAKNKEKVAETYIKLDSNIQKSNITFPELREAYTYLIDYYKEKNDKEKQLYYIDRFLKVDKKLDEQLQYAFTELPKKYDTPKLLEEKEDIINDLEKRKTILYAAISALLLILLLLTYLYYKSRRAERKHHKIAQDLIHSVEKRHKIDPETEVTEALIEELVQKEQKTIKNVPEEVVQAILKELQHFEKKEHFLKKGITLSSLARSINTNTTYLSEVINSHKEKSFTAYLNDLRVDYALERLIEDKRFRSYKLAIIADELGYNNAQAFTSAFKKKTHTTLSTYLKEIENTMTIK